MTHDEILGWLRETAPARLNDLWERADAVRRAHVGDAVHLRGLVEISNHCVLDCLYCGIRAHRKDLPRYRMRADEILAAAARASRLGFGTVVLQSGEDPGLTRDFVGGVIREIKATTGLAVTLSLGERSDDDYRAWRETGADRVLLRFETSDARLYAAIHPSLPGRPSDRIAQLRRLRRMGFEIGGGVMVGLPGQTWDTLARDIELFGELDLDMIGVGPFISSPATPLGGLAAHDFAATLEAQVPADELTTLKVVALARIVRPDANIPATTALATIDPAGGRTLGLARGANIVMPNLTPAQYRRLYEIYPDKFAPPNIEDWLREFTDALRSLGRRPGAGPGARVRQ